MSTDKITFLLNWRATPYHLPIFLAQAKGYYAEQGIKVAILEPNDPSDVTEIIGSGRVDMGAKAMVHTLAAKARGFPVTSFGLLSDEPITGIVYIKGNGITEDFQSLRGKRIGYVGEFGKIQIDELCSHYGMKPSDYTAVRCGMNITRAIKEGKIDAGIGLENVQCPELEQWLREQGRDPNDVGMLRIDELAELGCCCFCSILMIANDAFLKANPEKVKGFLRAVKKAADFMFEDPKKAWAEYQDFKPEMNTELNTHIFERSFIYFSRDCANVPRDWNKVTNYCKRLGILPDNFSQNYDNSYLSWKPDAEIEDPAAKQREVAEHQRQVAQGFYSVLGRAKDSSSGSIVGVGAATAANAAIPIAAN